MTVVTLKARSSALADPDVDLMLRVQRDDAAAFRSLLDRYRRRVHQQLFLMVGSHEEAEDLTQEVFLRVYRHRKTYLPRAKFATWLFHIVRNMARNCLRDRHRRPAMPILSAGPRGEDLGLQSALSDRHAEAPSRPLERQETRLVVRTALDRLAGRQRTALVLQQFQDRTYEDIAEHLALTPQAAKSLLYRARNQLREQLAPYVLAD